MTQKEAVRHFNENLFNDNDKAFSVVAEDATMEWPGWSAEPLRGRDAVRKFLEETGPERMISLDLLGLVEEGSEVIGHGTCVTERKGKSEKCFFADCYTFRDGKIAQVVSYMVMEPNKENNA